MAALLGAQVAAWALAGAGLVLPGLQRWRILRIASFFALVNASILVAWVHHLRGSRVTLWEPTRR
jgi:hypothetical protein